MRFSSAFKTHESQIAALFELAFGRSEGVEAGAQIGALARNLMAGTQADDLYVFTAWEDGALVGAIIFSRLSYEHDARSVFVLGPAAVAPDKQRQGVGQALIAHGLKQLREDQIDIAMTYGDPKYYSRVGFKPLTEAHAPAPFPLQHPHGWQGQSLTEAEFTPLKGPARCVPAFNDPAYW